ncbi:MAG TPA: hypothetical protein VGM20_02015 [Gemmatimonadales bacterium]|jgi:hypothetical protein
MSFGIYLAGYIILIVGLTLGATYIHIEQKWIVVMDICLVGIAILHGVTKTRQRDPAPKT